MATAVRRGDAPPLWTVDECTQIVANAKQSSSDIEVFLRRPDLCLETLSKVEQIYAESKGHLDKLRQIALLFYYRSFGFTPLEQPALVEALIPVVKRCEAQEKALSSRLEAMRREKSLSLCDRISASLQPGRSERELFLFSLFLAFGFFIYQGTLYIYPSIKTL